MVGTVGALYRYPVKSTAGEALEVADVDARGFVEDRAWAAYTAEGGIASGKSSRRFRKVDGLLGWRSTLGGASGDDRRPWVLDPAGTRYRAGDEAADAALTAALGQPLALRPETSISHYDDCGVHLVTTSAVRRAGQLAGVALDARRTRPNLLLETDGHGFVEDGWEGAELAVGAEVVLRVGPGMPRCVMVDQDHRDVPAAGPVLRSLGRHHDTLLGVQAEVVSGGAVRVGDEVRLRRP